MPEKDLDEIWRNFALHFSSSVKLEVPNSFHEGTFFFFLDEDGNKSLNCCNNGYFLIKPISSVEILLINGTRKQTIYLKN